MALTSKVHRQTLVAPVCAGLADLLQYAVNLDANVASCWRRATTRSWSATISAMPIRWQRMLDSSSARAGLADSPSSDPVSEDRHAPEVHAPSWWKVAGQSFDGPAEGPSLGLMRCPPATGRSNWVIY